MNKKNTILSDVGLLYCAAIWGSTFIVTKAALEFVHPISMVGIRFLIAAAILLPWVVKRKNKLRHMKDGFVLSFFLSLLYLTQTTGLLYTTASNSGFITGLFIIFIPVFMFLFKRKKPSLLQIISAFTALFGMWLLTGGVAGFNLGDGLTLIAAVAYSAHLIITDKYVKADADTILLAFHQFWMVALISLGISWIMGYPMVVTSMNGWWIIIFLAVFPTFTAFYIQMLAQKNSEPFKVGLIFTMEPVFAAMFAWTLGGESFMLIKAIGGLCIVSGMIIGEFSKFNLKRAFKKEVLPI
jgi:drug/metabolite transporter (DMT)-like permease